jgi:hypothetical protein
MHMQWTLIFISMQWTLSMINESRLCASSHLMKYSLFIWSRVLIPVNFLFSLIYIKYNLNLSISLECYKNEWNYYYIIYQFHSSKQTPSTMYFAHQQERQMSQSHIHRLTAIIMPLSQDYTTVIKPHSNSVGIFLISINYNYITQNGEECLTVYSIL